MRSLGGKPYVLLVMKLKFSLLIFYPLFSAVIRSSDLFWFRFCVENFVIDRHVRYILTIYPVVIWALVGNVSRDYDPEAPGRNATFTFTGESWQISNTLKHVFLKPFHASKMQHL